MSDYLCDSIINYLGSLQITVQIMSTHLQNLRILLVIELQAVSGADSELDQCILVGTSLPVAQIHLKALQASALLTAFSSTDEVPLA